MLSFETVAEGEAWFEANHADHSGFLLRIGKGDRAGATIGYPEAVEIALRFGWIDGQKRALDERSWLQRFTRRTARSRWSRINRDKAEALIGEGRMHPAGLAAVEAAKADGRWQAAYAGPKSATVPDDFAAALAADPEAAAFFATLTGANRFAFLYRIADAKRPATRAARITTFVEMCHHHKTLH